MGAGQDGPAAGGAAETGARAARPAGEADEARAGEDPRGARRLLERRRRDLERTLEAMEEGGLGESLGESLSELSTYDNHPADIGTETWQREQRLSMRRTLRLRVGEVEAALGRLDDGTYGRCAGCGAEIPRERLAARPEARLCVDCQDAEDGRTAPGGPAEARSQDPGEEEPAGQGAHSRDDEWDAFWGPLARYGSSDTPSDAPEAHREGPGRIGHLDEDDDDPDAHGMHIVTGEP